MSGFEWYSPQTLQPEKFTCPYCLSFVGGRLGFFARIPQTSLSRYVRLCTACDAAVYFDENGKSYPGTRLGRNVDALPEKVAAIYQEARDSAGASAFTGCVLLCRTLISHIAVDNKAPNPKGTFKEHIEHLVNAGVLQASAKPWVDRIRLQGNEATHDLEIATREDAEEILAFSEMVLRIVYEFPARLHVPKP